MKDENKTKEQLIKELVELRRRIAELGASETARKRAEKALWESEERYKALIQSATYLERKQAEEALRESEERFRVMFDHSHDLMTISDLKAGTIWANPAWQETLGYTPETQGDPFEKIHPDDQTRVWGAWQAMERGESDVANLEYRYRTAQGDYVLLETTARKLNVAGETLLYVVAHDITERKRAEEALQQAQEQLIRQEKLAVLGQLAGGVAHELRSPLGTIKNATYFLNMLLKDPDPVIKEMLEILEKEVGTSERIIRSLLDFARAKPPTRRKVNINDVVREALSRTAVPENVEVVSQLDETLPAIPADPDQLVQVFGNIILNGFQAMTSSSPRPEGSVEMPEGGQLLVKSEVPSLGWVAISFTDTGVGIPEENLDKLFEPLFTTKARGIGLGLALVKSLVEGHGGTIEVESEVGKGSIFTVRLPLGRVWPTG
jgi:PAS domain S-box-containing protein